MSLRITREAAERPKRRKKTQPPPSAEEERLRDKKTPQPDQRDAETSA